MLRIITELWTKFTVNSIVNIYNYQFFLIVFFSTFWKIAPLELRSFRRFTKIRKPFALTTHNFVQVSSFVILVKFITEKFNFTNKVGLQWFRTFVERRLLRVIISTVIKYFRHITNEFAEFGIGLIVYFWFNHLKICKKSLL